MLRSQSFGRENKIKIVQFIVIRCYRFEVNTARFESSGYGDKKKAFLGFRIECRLNNIFQWGSILVTVNVVGGAVGEKK